MRKEKLVEDSTAIGKMINYLYCKISYKIHSYKMVVLFQRAIRT